MNQEHFDRNIRFFGVAGQERLLGTTVAVVGVGGLGTHVVQQLSLSGVGGLSLIDHEELSESNRNRYIGVRHDDPVPGSPKVLLGKRLALSIRPSIRVETVFKSFVSEEGFAAIKEADYVFGCVDGDGARLVLLEACASFQKPYFDLATEIVPGSPPNYGGRVCLSFDGDGCLFCRGLLDLDEAAQHLAGDVEVANRQAVYGVDASLLATAGPSVAPLNGVVASVGVCEFMFAAAGVRKARPHLTYHGTLGRVSTSVASPAADCYYCGALLSGNAKASVERYFDGALARLGPQ